MAAVNQARAAVAIAYASDGLLQAQRLRRSDRSAQNDEEARQLLVNVVRRLQSSAANSPQLPVARRLLREVEQDIHRRNTAEDRRADPRDEALSGRIQFGLRLRHLGSLRRVLNELAESELRGDLPLPEAAKLATAQQSEIASNRTRTRPPSAGFAAKPRRRPSSQSGAGLWGSHPPGASTSRTQCPEWCTPQSQRDVRRDSRVRPHGFLRGRATHHHGPHRRVDRQE